MLPPKFPTKTAKYVPSPIGAYNMIIWIILLITSFKLSSSSSVFCPFSFDRFNARPNMIDAIINAIMLFMFRRSPKLFTDRELTNLSK